MNATKYSSAGVKSTAPVKLSAVFAEEVKSHQLLKEAYLAYQGNGRLNLAKTLKRGEVRGGGKKPWRQKGTGRARFGSTRNPIWRSGGIAFGPTGNENYKKYLPTKTKKQALRQALSLAANDKNKIIIIEDIKLKAPKTKDIAKILDKLSLSGNTLIVHHTLGDEINKAAANLPKVSLTRPKSLNVFDVLNSDNLLITSESLKEIDSWLGAKK